MLCDYHLHTPLCRHADGTVTEYLEAARRKTLLEIGFSDHAPNPDGYDSPHRMTVKEFSLYQDMLRPLLNGSRPAVLFGLEADYYPGCERFLQPFLQQHPFDYILGSVHYLEHWGFDNPEERHVWDSVDVTQTWRTYFTLMGRLAESRLFDIVGHLDLPKKFGHRPPEAKIRDMAQPALDKVAAAGMCIEINTSGLRKPVGEIYPSVLLLKLAREREIPITFGSDAHRPAEVGYAFDQALRLARKAGYTRTARYSRRQKTLEPLPE